jgi:hypothetical protein
MRNNFFTAIGLVAFVLFSALTHAADFPTRGLWVGEVTLSKVNETVVGINAQNQTVAPDPSVATPVQSPAHLRIILHVDNQGQVRLLKNVAVLNKSTNDTPDVALITDETLYPNFSSVGKRITAAAYDFGDDNAADILNRIALAAGAAAATNGNATMAATAVAQKADAEGIYQAFVREAGFRNAALNAAASASIGAIAAKGTNGNAAQILAAATGAAAANFYVVTNRAYALSLQNSALFPDTRFVSAVDSLSAGAGGGAAVLASSNLLALVGGSATNAALTALTNAINAPAIVSPGYQTFLTTASFQSAAALAGAAASTAAAQATLAGSLPAVVLGKAQAAALKALTDAGVFVTADRVVNNELLITGNFAADGTLTGLVYLGANHPTNPFMHRRHADHSTGYTITRKLRIQFDSATSTNAVQTTGFGVDKIGGTYHEEIFGLHKPLGPNQDIGLITEGTISLSRISQVDTLNQ